MVRQRRDIELPRVRRRCHDQAMGTPQAAPAVRRWAPPPWGGNGWTLAVAQLAAAGILIPFVAAASLWSMWTEYDGLLTIIGMVVLPVVVSMASVAAGLIVGLPIRLIPPVRRWWLSHGGATLGVACSGLAVVVLGTILVRTTADAGASEQSAWLVLLVGWAVFCLGTLHLVWPKRWDGASARRKIRAPASDRRSQSSSSAGSSSTDATSAMNREIPSPSTTR